MLTVDAVKPARRGGLMVVSLSDGSLVRLSPDAVVALGIVPGCEVTEALSEEMEATRVSEAVRRTAANIVSACPVSTAELTRRLVRKGYPEGESAAAAEWLVSLGVLDDEAYAAALVEKYARQGLSRRAAAAKLAEKGVPRDLAEEAMAAFPDQRDALVRLILQKGLPADREGQAKLTAALARRGFGYEEIRAALRIAGGEDPCDE